MKLKTYTAQLTKAQYKKHLNHAARYGRCKIQAEDHVQNSFLRFLSGDHDTEQVASYVGFTIMNESRRAYRESRIYRQSIPVNDEVLGSETPTYYSISPIITEAVNTLLPRQKQVVTLFLLEVKLKDIATQLDITYDTAKAHYRHAMLKIKTYLENEGYQHGN